MQDQTENNTLSLIERLNKKAALDNLSDEERKEYDELKSTFKFGSPSRAIESVIAFDEGPRNRISQFENIVRTAEEIVDENLANGRGNAKENLATLDRAAMISLHLRRHLSLRTLAAQDIMPEVEHVSKRAADGLADTILQLNREIKLCAEQQERLQRRVIIVENASRGKSAGASV